MTTPTPTPTRPANRLAGESSPYLLQHAHNPVDWWPWGPEAIAEARRRDVPIFLSIGYSTCYWCHVMERESFEDEATAAVMNELFVNIKLDREERPDLDDVYMAAVQTLTGRGGWPMSVFLEPSALRPYYAGTYFPPRPAHGMPSFTQVLRGMSQAYRDRRAEVLAQAGEVAAAVSENLARPAGVARLGVDQVAMATQTLLTIADRAEGGFGGAPKFPQPVCLEFLLDVRRSADPDSRGAIDTALKTTLDHMAFGGMHDQLGGGFHRYSVDRTWTVPHFEKMLYDNAMLLAVYAQAGVVFGDGYYAEVARSTARYVLREMTAPGGAFYTAQDAEVNGREGLNYLWTSAEAKDALPDAGDAALALDVLGLNAGPNFRDPHHPDDPPRNVLRFDARPDAVAARMGLGAAAWATQWTRVREALLAVRERRPAPRLDDKVLASWNGLMIAGLAEAGRLLGEASWVAAAQRAADWLLTHHRGADGRLLRTSRGGPARIPAMLEDLAMLMRGLLALARAKGERGPGGAGANLAAARALLAEADTRFADGAGGYYETAADATELFVRTQPTYDGALPSGLSVMVNNLVDLAELTGEAAMVDRAVAVLKVVSVPLAESPVARVHSVRGLLRVLQLDAAKVAAAFADADADPAVPSRLATDPVTVFADEEQVLLEPGGAAGLTIRVEIAEGYHLLAPGETASAYAPLRLSVIGGEGVAAYADYPAGEPLDPADQASPRAYRGVVELPVALERRGAWTGRPALALTFQACTDRACEQARTVRLDVELRPVSG